ncbi:MAG: prolyl oligopeptidase family serine peptidase [Pseudohongiellaceae bacterium]
MSKSLASAAVILLSLLLGGCDRAASPSVDRTGYPFAQRLPLTDFLHGTSVHDPYRWLETGGANSAENSAEVSDWLAAQQLLSDVYFADLPDVAAVRESLAQLWQFERREVPRRFGERWFLFRNTDSADHYTLDMQSDPTAEPVTLLDPGEWTSPPRVLAAVSISPDGRYLAWLQTDAEGQQRRWHLRDLDADTDAAESVLEWLDVDDIVWRPDSQGFYYSAGVSATDSTSTGIYFRAVQQAALTDVVDELVHESANVIRVLAAAPGPILIFTEEVSTAQLHTLMIAVNRAGSQPVSLGAGAPGTLQFLDSKDGKLLFLSTREAPAGSVISIDPAVDGAMSPTVVVAAGQRQIISALPVSNGVLVEYMDAGVSALELVATDGSRHTLPLPGPGRIAAFSEGERDDEVFLNFSTLTDPGAIFRLNTLTGEISTLFTPVPGFAPEEFVVERVTVPSAQSEGIPLLIAGRRDRVRAEGSNVLLEVYGGFGIPMDAGFSIARLGWMERGGVYVLAAVRGGGELGPQWHEEAKGVGKSRSIDDLLMAVQYLHEQGYVERGRLALMGASHGAMLAAAAMNREPAQFGAVILSAGPMDMVRLSELGGAESWQEEYGSVEAPEQFAAMLSYSPYHNVRPGTAYPAVLLLTSESDDVVAPAHSYKFAAQLQAMADPSRPVLLRTRPGAGHFDTGSVEELIAQYAERWAYLLYELGR